MHLHQPWVAHCCWFCILVSYHFFWSPFGSHGDTFAEMLQLPFHANETVVPDSFLPFPPGRDPATKGNLSTMDPFAFLFCLLFTSCTCSFNLLPPTHYLPPSPTTAAASVFPFLPLISSLTLPFLHPLQTFVFPILFLVFAISPRNWLDSKYVSMVLCNEYAEF